MPSTEAQKNGVLLVNTGSSAAPEVPETRAYLRQFLSDPRILDMAAWKRWLLLNLIILPTRPKKTAEAYKAIWTPRGSPLIAISEAFRDALAARLPDHLVALGMAYGAPSVHQGIDKLIAGGASKIIVVPMFPQYASATTGSVLNACYEYAASRWNVPSLAALPPFHDDELFLQAWTDVAAPELQRFQPEHVVLSYHGLPERHIHKSDPTGQWCLRNQNCCSVRNDANVFCYRRQCIETSGELVRRLGLEQGKYTIAFQSRLGRDPWLGPATDQTIAALAQQGIKRLAILSPAFVADCLETLEEIGIQAKESFLHNGGAEFMLVPSLNTHPTWVEAMARLIQHS